MSNPKPPVQPRAYVLTATPLPFSRGTYFRWEKQNLIPPLLRIGGKTLLQSETVEAIITGKIVLPSNPGHIKGPQPRSGRRRIAAE